MLRLTVQQRENEAGLADFTTSNEERRARPLDEPESLMTSNYDGRATIPDKTSGLIHRKIGFESDLEIDESEKKSTT